MTKTGTSNTEFIDFSNGLFPTGQGTWTVTGSGTTQLDYGQFDKISPSLKITAGVSISHPLSITTPRFFEFRARSSDSTKISFFELDNSLGSTLVGVSFSDTAPGVLSVSGYTGGYHSCAYAPGGTSASYVSNAWYRITVDIDWNTANYPFRVFLNGMDLSCPGSTLQMGPGATVSKLFMYLDNVGWYTWVDDIKIYNNVNGQTGYSALNIGFVGLQPRQSISLLAADGSVIDQTMQTVAGTTLWLSFNEALWYGPYMYAENGDNAKTIVQIYAEDGTLEYQSPLTRFFVGEQYVYTRPQAFADEVVKSQSGSLFWPNIATADYADDSDFCGQTGIVCGTGWNWMASPDIRGATRGNHAHVMLFDYGTREQQFTLPSKTAPSYFVTYIRIPAGKAPDSIGFVVQMDAAPYDWKEVYWGSPPGDTHLKVKYMGPVPAARDQWVQLVISASDIGLATNWKGMSYVASGGEIHWDVTTTQTVASWTDAYLKVSGLPSGVTVGVYYANNATQIGTAAESSGVANVLLYQSSKGIDSFPIKVNIKVYKATDEYYFGPARDVWPGDTFRYDVGASSFFDSKSGGTTYWPSSSIHTALLGSKKSSGDCLNAVVCYDMETMTETTTAVDTGVVAATVLDLSGKAKVVYYQSSGSRPRSNFRWDEQQLHVCAGFE